MKKLQMNINYRTFSFLLFTFLLTNNLTAQEELSDMSVSRSIVVPYGDSILTIEVLTTNSSDEEIDKNATYYWFINNQLNKNVGGYSGQLLHGDYQVKLNTGELITRGNFEYGLKEGSWIKWYKNGMKKSSSIWEKGYLNGNFIVWDENGVKQSEYLYEKGIKEGEYSLYHDSGVIAESGKMKGNKKSGTIKTYREDKSISSAITYDEGKKNGWSRIYDEEGKLTYKQRYEDGVLIPKMKKDSSEFKWKFWKKDKTQEESGAL